MSNNTIATTETKATADRRSDASLLVKAVSAALDAHEQLTRRKIARAREMLGEVKSWAETGRRSPLAKRYVDLFTEMREHFNDDENDAGTKLGNEFWDSAAFSSAIEAAFEWSEQMDEPRAETLDAALEMLLFDISEYHHTTRDPEVCRQAAMAAMEKRSA